MGTCDCASLIAPSSLLFTCISQEEEVGSCKRISCLGLETSSSEMRAFQNHHFVGVDEQQQNGAFCVSARRD